MNLAGVDAFSPVLLVIPSFFAMRKGFIRRLSYIAKTNDEHVLLQIKPPDLPENPQLLKVALLGAPNSGKSTLFNNLLGRKISPVSKRENTTRHRITGVFTDNNKQIVFLDTPGIFPPWKLKSKSNFRPEKSLLLDPHSSLWESDLIVYVHDCANKFTQYKLIDELLQCLFAHPNKEAILVLNKIDRLHRKRQLLDLTWRLTIGQLNGEAYMPVPDSMQDLLSRKLVDKTLLFRNTDNELGILENCGLEIESGDKTTNLISQHKDFEELARLETEMMCELENEQTGTSPQVRLLALEVEKKELSSPLTEDVTHPITPAQFLEDLGNTTNYHLYYQKLSHAKQFVAKYNNSWPYFSQVFMVSALKNDGLSELKRYLFSRCRPGQWIFHRDIMTDQYPHDIAVLLVREIMFELLPEEIPYVLQMDIDKWYLDPNTDVLFITINIHPRKKSYSRDVGALLKNHGEAVKAIANLAQINLMDAFRCDVCLKLNVKLTTK